MMSRIVYNTQAQNPMVCRAENYVLVDGGICEPKWLGAGWQFKWVEQGWPTRSGWLGGMDGRSCDTWTPGATYWEWAPETPGDQTMKLISGTTVDSNGALLPNCTVNVHRTSDGLLAATTTSNGNSYFETYVPDTSNYYIVSFLAGSPDVAGATDNNIAGV